MSTTRLPPRHWARDVLPVLPLLVFALVGTHYAGMDQQELSNPSDGLALALAGIGTLAAVWRHRNLEAAFIASTAAAVVYLTLGYSYGPILVVLVWLAYSAGAQWPVRRVAAWVGGALLALVVAVGLRSVLWDLDPGGWVAATGFGSSWATTLAAAAAIGAAVRTRRESSAAMRQEQVRRELSEEQLRMARELHDVVGHGLAVIAMQAGVALHVLERDPGKVRESLQAIRDTSRESLDGLRAELARMRGTAEREPAALPAQGLAEVEALASRVSAGGIDVDVDLDGEIDRVPAETGAAAYRIVQEALTNVVRHSEASAARVRLIAGDAALLVEVTDRGRGGEVDGGGSGIAGMRARAEALGGTLRAGPRPDGGFAVRATLPL